MNSHLGVPDVLRERNADALLLYPILHPLVKPVAIGKVRFYVDEGVVSEADTCWLGRLGLARGVKLGTRQKKNGIVGLPQLGRVRLVIL